MSMGSSGEGAVADFDDAMRRMSAWKGQIDKLATDTKAMGERLQELRVTAMDEDKLVGVVLDSGGTLVDLRLHQRSQGMPPDELAKLIMDTVRFARKKLADRSRQIVTDTLGPQSPAAHAIADQVDQRLRSAVSVSEPAADRDGR